MRKLFHILAVYATILLSVLLVLSYLSVKVSPEKFWIIAFLGLGYPYILILSFITLLYWVFLKRWYFWIPLATILAGWGFLARIIQVPLRGDPGRNHEKSEYKDTIRLLSYNVRAFNLYNWANNPEAESHIFTFIRETAPDIICFQEFYSREKGAFTAGDVLRELKNNEHYHIYYSQKIKGISNFGIATFSRYPVINKGTITFPNTHNICIYTDIVTPNDTIRVYNNHLQSVKFKKRNYDYIDTLRFKYSDRHVDEIRDISYRLRDAFIKRSRQVDIISGHIRNSPYPVIVCGDFNDTPYSYTYEKMRGGLNDAFIEAGSWIGNTYRGKFPSFRIDFILYSDEFEALNLDVPRLTLSDHFPVQSDILVKR
ncbi:MAG: endonuclease/exonuclease/phosphatase family protein [Bacteroidales bacterium]